MRAVLVPSAGDRPVLADLPEPSPDAGEVLVRVRAAALNPMDNTLVAGDLAEMIEHRYPLVLGRDVAGVVERLGADVAGLAIGDEVIGHVAFEAPFERGVLAEFAVLPASSLVRKPDSVDARSAASLPLAGAAALAAIDAAEVGRGQTVLISGASGGVGRYAVQLCAARGATVIATGRAHEEPRLRELGASDVVDYTRGAVAEQVLSLYPDGVDTLVTLFGETDADVPFAAVRAGGVVSTIRPVADVEVVAAHGLRGGGITIASPGADVLARLAGHAAAGDLVTDIHRVISIEQAVDGLAEIAAGRAEGKIVVDLDLDLDPDPDPEL